MGPFVLGGRAPIESTDEIGDDPAMTPLHLSRLIAAALAVCAAMAVGAAGGDGGRDIAAACASCHQGKAGAVIPALAGMDKATLLARMREFRDGRRPSTVMRELASGYTDAQIEAAASYLSAQTP